MAHNIRQQLRYAVSTANAIGTSKRAAKFDSKNRDVFRKNIYGQKHYRDIDKIASELGQWIRSTHPEIRMITDITSRIIAEFVSSKACVNCDQSLKKIKSLLMKLETICISAFPHSVISWNVSEISTPPSRKTGGYHKDLAMDRETADLIEKTMRETQRSRAWLGVSIGGRIGLRVEETSLMQVERFVLFPKSGDPNNIYGFGYYDLLPGDGSKGNRPRVCPIHTAEDREEIIRLLSKYVLRLSGYVVTSTRQPDTPLDPESINRQIGRAMKKIGLNFYQDYLGDKMHSWRKMYAQQTWDIQRRRFHATKEEARAAVNTELGHGENRINLCDVYVKNQW